VTSSENPNERETVVLSCRVTKRFAELVKKYCSLDSHLNPADLIRDATREKIQKEAPALYAELLQEAKAA
jgi:hypothetical protein